VRSQPHLKHIPSYLMPKIASVSKAVAEDEAAAAEGSPSAPKKESRVSFHKNKGGKSQRNRKTASSRGPKVDPLKKFASKRR
jgi:ATP-dependent RNA helicase DDX56/DBP9